MNSDKLTTLLHDLINDTNNFNFNELKEKITLVLGATLSTSELDIENCLTIVLIERTKLGKMHDDIPTVILQKVIRADKVNNVIEALKETNQLPAENVGKLLKSIEKMDNEALDKIIETTSKYIKQL